MKDRKTLAIILGTRPEIIKLSSLIRLLQKRKTPHFLVHTGQHYSYALDQLFFKELGLALPRYRIPRPKQMSAVAHTGFMMGGVERILIKERPSHALVQGDTNSALAGALAASKLNEICLGHVEAGLRSYDRAMPEENNRIIADHLSTLLFAPTIHAKGILLKEGIASKKIVVTGNTIVDAVVDNLAIARKNRKLILKTPKKYFLLTLHRQENVDIKTHLVSILRGLALVIREFKRPILFPIHPRTAIRLREFGLRLPQGVQTMKPVSFLSFLNLEASAELILTDSGGLQEEACIFKVPCVTLRTSTERPETIAVGSNVITGYSPKCILKSAQRMLFKPRRWKHPFGDGHASQKILSTILNN